MELTTEEQLIVDEYKRLDDALDECSKSMEEIFRRGLEEYLKVKDFSGAIEYMRLMPSSVPQMFIADAIRCARGDFD